MEVYTEQFVPLYVAGCPSAPPPLILIVSLDAAAYAVKLIPRHQPDDHRQREQETQQIPSCTLFHSLNLLEIHRIRRFEGLDMIGRIHYNLNTKHLQMYV